MRAEINMLIKIVMIGNSAGLCIRRNVLYRKHIQYAERRQKEYEIFDCFKIKWHIIFCYFLDFISIHPDRLLYAQVDIVPDDY